MCPLGLLEKDLETNPAAARTRLPEPVRQAHSVERQNV